MAWLDAGRPLSIVERVAAQWRHTINDRPGAVATPARVLWQIYAIGNVDERAVAHQIETETLVLAGATIDSCLRATVGFLALGSQ